MDRELKIQYLRDNKLRDFNAKITKLRGVMRDIGKNSITLYTSEPIGPGHTYGLDKKYSLIVGLDKITFLTNNNQTMVVDDAYINSCKWFQVYIYTVEVALELNKIANHISDSISVSEGIDE